ncbi:MAG: hypothetical protein FWC95_05010 [Defluviitaleaceae bacterium]|nr:hypothetical protein [Defluviitaleaceae bacterium]
MNLNNYKYTYRLLSSIKKEEGYLENEYTKYISLLNYWKQRLEGSGSNKHKNFVNKMIKEITADIIKLESLIFENFCKVVKERVRIEEFLSNIDDCEARLIVRRRLVDGWTWEKIGFDLFMDRTSASKKYKKMANILKERSCGEGSDDCKT